MLGTRSARSREFAAPNDQGAAVFGYVSIKLPVTRIPANLGFDRRELSENWDETGRAEKRDTRRFSGSHSICRSLTCTSMKPVTWMARVG
jgi:hypothetical protein